MATLKDKIDSMKVGLKSEPRSGIQTEEITTVDDAETYLAGYAAGYKAAKKEEEPASDLTIIEPMRISVPWWP